MGRTLVCAAAMALGLTVTAVARAGDLEGRSGPLAWRATDVQQSTVTVDGKRHARHEFALTVKNTGAGPLSLSGYEAAISYFGVPMNEMAGPLQVTVPSGRVGNTGYRSIRSLPVPMNPAHVGSRRARAGASR